MLAPVVEPAVFEEPLPAAWVGLAELELPRFLTFATALYFAEAAVQHPLSVLKTRLQHSPSLAQAASTGGSLAALLTARRVLGLRGLYTLFLPATLAALPSELAYVGGLEAGRQALQPVQHRLAHLLGGRETLADGCLTATAAVGANVAALTIYTPVEVVCARAFSQAPERMGGGVAAVVREVYLQHGLRGFWTGYGASLATHGPACAVWWSVYAMARDELSKRAEETPLWLCEASAGLAAGVTSALITHPLDTIRVRLQSGAEAGQPGGWGGAAARMLRQRGARGFFAGSGLRALQLGPLSAVGAASYEWIKRSSRTAAET